MESATQLLSKHVHQKVTLVKGQTREIRGDYVGIAHQFPMLIRRNGLVQALRYVKYQADRKKEKDKVSGHELFFKHFCDSGPQGEPVLTLTSFVPPNVDLVQAIEDISLKPDYLRATQVALIQADWFKRFAQSVLEAESTAALSTGPASLS